MGDLSYFIKKRDKLADNPALRDMVQKYPMPPAGGLNEVIVRHFLKQLASAMEFLRDRNFIHRDVKPQNLLLLPSPQYLAKFKSEPTVMQASTESMVPRVGLESLPMLKIADFGFARSLPATSLAETLCGSPLYMAPEILRYEKYDAKADLWSIGTVLYEMITGRPPFKATNHVELLRKIEQSDDQIRFPSASVISSSMKELVRALLKRTPVERLPFEKFFKHHVVLEIIPGLVGDDIPEDVPLPKRTSSVRSNRESTLRQGSERHSTSPANILATPPSPRTKIVEPVRQLAGTPPTAAKQQLPSRNAPLSRPGMLPSQTAPNPQAIQGPRPGSSTGRRSSRTLSTDEVSKPQAHPVEASQIRKLKEAEDANQAVQDERDYVLVDKRAVVTNALADQMAADARLQTVQSKDKPEKFSRRNTTQGHPVSATGAVPAEASRAVQIAQGKTTRPNVPERAASGRGSYGSPSATSAIAKALHGASLRVFGHGWAPHLIGKGVSPPQMYSPFPAYPTPQGAIGLIGDGRASAPIDEDQKAVNVIEESATRSDVVYGFAEVKYKQLIPLAPSMDHGLGGSPAPNDDDEGLTVEAVVALSEEALVLYVKALSLLAKSMDIAGGWWSRKNRADAIGHIPRSDTLSSAGNRINGAVQWVRNRFNEVLEKAEFVRLKLLDAQKQLPLDHPGHPDNHTSASHIAGASSTDGVVLSSGITAEKLMYDRAIEMSRSAAINEIANEDLPGCEISYITAIRMLEAVLESDDEPAPRKRASSFREEREKSTEAESTINGINLDDRQAVLKGTLSIFFH